MNALPRLDHVIPGISMERNADVQSVWVEGSRKEVRNRSAMVMGRTLVWRWRGQSSKKGRVSPTCSRDIKRRTETEPQYQVPLFLMLPAFLTLGQLRGWGRWGANCYWRLGSEEGKAPIPEKWDLTFREESVPYFMGTALISGKGGPDCPVLSFSILPPPPPPPPGPTWTLTPACIRSFLPWQGPADVSMQPQQTHRA